ncbi:sulfatase family protein [Shewanella woodyi]|uniref:sulfatase family protein n=1 Tax=Shewanella woodyi TaxID=60961 RepID=UPI00374A6DB1
MGRLLLASVLACLLPFSSSQAQDNLLFIMTDEMKWNVMGVAGHSVVKTPNLDKLASEGTYYKTAYTVAPICSPSRRSFFTSRYTHVHGVIDNSKQALANDGEVDLQTILKHEGYRTAISGKLHFYPEWHDWGFDEFWARSSEGPNRLETYRQYMVAKHGDDAFKPIKGSVTYPNDPLGHDLGRYRFGKEDFETYWLTDKALGYLARKEKKPFFLFLSYNEPHSPYMVTEPYASMYDPKTLPVPVIPESAKTERKVALEKKIKGKSRHLIDDEQMMRDLTAQYLGHVSNVDDNVGRVLSYLDSSGLADSTIVVFTADHGNMLGDHGKWFKGVMHEGSSRIPLIIRAGKNTRYAKIMNRGRVVEQVVESIDVMPTLLEMLDIKAPTGMQGESLLSLSSGGAKNWKNRAFSQRSDFMFREGDFKLIMPAKAGKKGKLELYNLANDPLENHNLAGMTEYQAKVKSMQQSIQVWQADKPAPIHVDGLTPPEHLFNSELLRNKHSQSFKAMMFNHPKHFKDESKTVKNSAGE